MKQKIQANINGYMGKACSLFGVLDTDTGVLHILKQASKFQDRNEDYVLISNTPRTENDFMFEEDLTLDAIKAYYRLKGDVAKDGITQLLNIGAKVGGADPQSAIDIAGIDTNGVSYKISPDVKNIQVAVLAICLYVEKNRVIEDALSMFKDLDNLYLGAFTI